MELYTLLLVTASNFMGIVPILALISSCRYFGACITTIAMIASIIMNSTETRRNMPALFWAQYSEKIRNVERIIAHCVGFYGVYLFFTNPITTMVQIILPVTGAMALFGSDHVQNLKYYTILQVYWHFAIYMSLYLVVH